MIAGLIVYAQFRTELYAITQELQAAGAGAAIFSTTGVRIERPHAGRD